MKHIDMIVYLIGVVVASIALVVFRDAVPSLVLLLLLVAFLYGVRRLAISTKARWGHHES